MATRRTRRDTGSHRVKISIRAMVALVGVYSTFYLTAAGVAHFLTSPEAVAAIVPPSIATPATAVPASAGTIETAGGLSAPERRNGRTAAVDTARERGPETAID